MWTLCAQADAFSGLSEPPAAASPQTTDDMFDFQPISRGTHASRGTFEFHLCACNASIMLFWTHLEMQRSLVVTVQQLNTVHLATLLPA